MPGAVAPIHGATASSADPGVRSLSVLPSFINCTHQGRHSAAHKFLKRSGDTGRVVNVVDARETRAENSTDLRLLFFVKRVTGSTRLNLATWENGGSALEACARQQTRRPRTEGLMRQWTSEIVDHVTVRSQCIGRRQIRFL